MKKVAVFGNAGGGKSTLAIKLAEATGLPLHVIDKMQFHPGGASVPPEDFKRAHDAIVSEDRWIVDGYGGAETLWPRLNAADSLVFVDLPLHVHFWWVTKRFVTGFFIPPEGWPEHSPILKSSLSSYRVLWLCHKHLTPRYREYVRKAGGAKKVHHLQSTAQIAAFYRSMKRGEFADVA